MLTCRSIPPETWEHARRVLVFYFSRHMVGHAEDLAQETLTALWRREDYLFKEEKHFLLICYGFARNILREARRADRRAAVELPGELATAPHRMFGLSEAELAVFLDQVIAAGETQLAHDWNVILNEIQPGEKPPNPGQSANSRRVQLHRARRRLARLVGWKSDESGKM